MWAISTVLKPRDTPKAMKASIREMPVTISAFNIGILVIPMTMVWGICFMLLMAMEAAVPMMVAISADKNAISRVFCKAAMMLRLANIWVYHCSVNPPHWVRDLELLKDNTTMVAIGAYKNSMMSTR